MIVELEQVSVSEHRDKISMALDSIVEAFAPRSCGMIVGHEFLSVSPAYLLLVLIYLVDIFLSVGQVAILLTAFLYLFFELSNRLVSIH